MKNANLKLLTIKTIKIYAMTDFGKFFWRKCVQKRSIQHVVELKSYYKIYINTLKIFSPCKKKYPKSGNIFFMNKFLA